MCVCMLFLAVSSQCVLFSFPNETHHYFLKGRKQRFKERSRLMCRMDTAVCLCVCVFLGTVYKGASGKSSNTA